MVKTYALHLCNASGYDDCMCVQQTSLKPLLALVAAIMHKNSLRRDY